MPASNYKFTETVASAYNVDINEFPVIFVQSMDAHYEWEAANATPVDGSDYLGSVFSNPNGRWVKSTARGGGGGSGTVTSVSVTTANGLAGTVMNPTTTPAISLSTTITGVLKGNGTAISAATSGTDYVAPGGPLGTPSSGTLTNATGLPLATGVTGILPVANGGTGASSLTSNALLTGNGSSPVQAEITLTYSDAGGTGTLTNSSTDAIIITTPIDSTNEIRIQSGESTVGVSAPVGVVSGQGVTGSGDVFHLSGEVVGNGNTGAAETRSGALTGDGNTGNLIAKSGAANGDNVITGNFVAGSGAFVSTTSGGSGSAELFSGDGNGPGDSGQVLVYSGQTNTGSSGGVFLRSGPTTGTGVLSGAVRISSGNAGGGTDSSSGAILLTTGTKSGTGERGILDFSARYIRAAAPWVTRNAGGTAQADAFQELPSVINSFQTAEIDLKTTGTYTFTVPTGFRFYPDEVRVFITSVSGLTVNATFRAGISGTPAKFVAATLMTAATQFARTRYDSLTADGETNFQVEITTGATATTFNGRFIFIGQLIEVE